MAVVRRRSSLPQAPRFQRADAEALSAQLNEPTWMLERRLEAWELYDSLPMPYLEEEWRRTDYRHIHWADAEAIPQPNGASANAVPAKNLEPLTGDEQGGLLVFVDGQVVRHEIADELRRQGVVFTDLGTALLEHEDIVRSNFMTTAVKASDGKFAALHAALWNYGVFIYIPRSTAVRLPMHVVCYNSASGAALGHVLVVVEDGAQATVQVEYASKDSDKQSSYIGATELIVA